MTAYPEWGPWAPPDRLRAGIFERAPHGREECRVCHRRGLAGGRWQWPCVLAPEHPYVCSCGARYPSRAAIAAHIRAEDRWRPRDHHARVSPELGAEPAPADPRGLLG